MHHVSIAIILNTIIEQYVSENQFYEQQLGIDASQWEAWKAGKVSLSPAENQKVKLLFSDYEWMLIQKLVRQTVIYPEKRHLGVQEFKKMKTQIARKWLGSDLAKVEILTQSEEIVQYLDLRVSITYDEWGYDDILNFRLPAFVQQQIKNDKVELLTWVKENLEETYH
ncbi:MULTISPECIES: hypothetical protein [unclassified Enterococcus]|jgi:hypothetical protein|uniref:hypothetical protein n=1 Tax=unclassified Enterococcus TaxID=2608891 RepID=UPI0006B9839B|nr:MULTISPECIES: hypothetical protein [unclassified Enterococcus]KPG69605.1 hypothetical protein AEQ18_12970 [Enterococcus sp. RIT-PI-f]